MRSEMKSDNCIKQESENSQAGQISNKSLIFNYFMVINLQEKYFRLLNSEVKETFKIYGNELEYSGASKSVGYGWTKDSYIASGEMIVNAEKGTLSDQSRGTGTYRLNIDTVKDCDEYYFDQGKIILQ